MRINLPHGSDLGQYKIRTGGDSPSPDNEALLVFSLRIFSISIESGYENFFIFSGYIKFCICLE